MNEDLSSLLDSPAPEASDSERRESSYLAGLQTSLERDVILATKLLQEKLRALNDIVFKRLPDAMRAIGQSKFTLLDGVEVKLSDKLIGTKVVDPQALAYAESLGGASLIKTAITIEMDRGDLEDARELMRELRAHRLANRFKTLTMDESIHQSTAASFAGQLEDEGKAPDLAKLGVTRITRSIVGRSPKQVELKGLVER